MSGPAPPVVRHGWVLYAHPCFIDRLEELIGSVERLKAKDPAGYLRRNDAKRLKAIATLAFATIPQDPGRPEFRQGNTLGGERRHWFRAKFFQQYRLFYRYRQDMRVIVYAWVNDEDTKRAYGRSDDAYRTFGLMLDRKRPPDDWDTLLGEARASAERLKAAAERIART